MTVVEVTLPPVHYINLLILFETLNILILTLWLFWMTTYPLFLSWSSQVYYFFRLMWLTDSSSYRYTIFVPWPPTIFKTGGGGDNTRVEVWNGILQYWWPEERERSCVTSMNLTRWPMVLRSKGIKEV